MAMMLRAVVQSRNGRMDGHFLQGVLTHTSTNSFGTKLCNWRSKNVSIEGRRGDICVSVGTHIPCVRITNLDTFFQQWQRSQNGFEQMIQIPNHKIAELSTQEKVPSW